MLFVFLSSLFLLNGMICNPTHFLAKDMILVFFRWAKTPLYISSTFSLSNRLLMDILDGSILSLT